MSFLRFIFSFLISNPLPGEIYTSCFETGNPFGDEYTIRIEEVRGGYVRFAFMEHKDDKWVEKYPSQNNDSSTSVAKIKSFWIKEIGS